MSGIMFAIGRSKPKGAGLGLGSSDDANDQQEEKTEGLADRAAKALADLLPGDDGDEIAKAIRLLIKAEIQTAKE